MELSPGTKCCFQRVWKSHSLVVERLGYVESKTSEVGRREKEVECSCVSKHRSVETRVGHVRREVEVTVKAIEATAAHLSGYSR